MADRADDADLHCVRDSNTRHANLVDGAVDREKIHEVGTERVFAGKSDLKTLGLDELDDLDRSLFVCQYGVRYRPSVWGTLLCYQERRGSR